MAKIKLKYVNAFANKRRSNAQLRYYFRRRGQKAIPLPGLPGSEDFMRAYQMALAMLPTLQPIGARRTAPGTINSLVVSYYQSDAWNKLAPDTRKTRRRFIERLRQEHGDKRVALLRREHVELMLAKIARPTTRRHWLKAVRPLLQYAVRAGMGKDDPTAGIETPKLPKSKGHHAWTDAEIAQYRKHWALGTQQRLVLEFALETTSRKGEVVRLGPQHIKDGWIRIERTHGSADVEIPMTPELQAAVDAMGCEHLTFIVTAYGNPRSKYGLGNDFAQWATEAGLPTRCRLHGLKKAGMRRLAEHGATAHELMGVSGHKTLTEVQRYTADADRKRLAQSGMAKLLRGETENSHVTNATRKTHKPGAKSLQSKAREQRLALLGETPSSASKILIRREFQTTDRAYV